MPEPPSFAELEADKGVAPLHDPFMVAVSEARCCRRRLSFQHALEDCECRWNIADVDPDLMDLSDTLPFKCRDVRAFRSKRR